MASRSKKTRKETGSQLYCVHDCIDALKFRLVMITKDLVVWINHTMCSAEILSPPKKPIIWPYLWSWKRKTELVLNSKAYWNHTLGKYYGDFMLKYSYILLIRDSSFVKEIIDFGDMKMFCNYAGFMKNYRWESTVLRKQNIVSHLVIFSTPWSFTVLKMKLNLEVKSQRSLELRFNLKAPGCRMWLHVNCPLLKILFYKDPQNRAFLSRC